MSGWPSGLRRQTQGAVPSVPRGLRVFWSTDVGVGSNPTSDTLLLCCGLIRMTKSDKIYMRQRGIEPINCLEGNYANHYTTDAHGPLPEKNLINVENVQKYV